MPKRYFAFSSLMLLLAFSACTAQLAAAPTRTPLPPTTAPATQTQTQARTATATAEPTPTETPTPEVKQYPICAVENFRDCPIPVEDLFNGEYHRWLKTLSQPFDPEKLKWVPMMMDPFEPVIIYDDTTVPNYENPEERPFRRSPTAGVTTLVNPDGSSWDYLILPIEYADPSDPGNPEKNLWVIGVQGLYLDNSGKSLPGGIVKELVRVWQEDMNIAPLIMISKNTPHANRISPLVDLTWQKYGAEEMNARIEWFKNGDPGALDGLAIGVYIAKVTSGKRVYE